MYYRERVGIETRNPGRPQGHIIFEKKAAACRRSALVVKAFWRLACRWCWTVAWAPTVAEPRKWNMSAGQGLENSCGGSINNTINTIHVHVHAFQRLRPGRQLTCLGMTAPEWTE